MARKHIKTGIDELEALFRANLHNLQVLGEIREELSFRKTDRAKQLLREVHAIEEGVVPRPPKPPRPERPDDQGEVL
jgi:hypothetical protein